MRSVGVYLHDLRTFKKWRRDGYEDFVLQGLAKTIKGAQALRTLAALRRSCGKKAVKRLVEVSKIALGPRQDN